MAKNCKDCLLHPFWIKREERDLTMSFATTHSTKASSGDITYICGDGEEEGYDLSDWFYETVKKMREMEKNGELFIFEIRAYPHNKYHYCNNDLIQEYNSGSCTESCEDM